MMCGRPQKLSRADMEMVRRWAAERRALGSLKHLAARLGVSKTTASKAVNAVIRGERMYKRELA